MEHRLLRRWYGNTPDNDPLPDYGALREVGVAPVPSARIKEPSPTQDDLVAISACDRMLAGLQEQEKKLSRKLDLLNLESCAMPSHPRDQTDSDREDFLRIEAEYKEIEQRIFFLKKVQKFYYQQLKIFGAH